MERVVWLEGAVWLEGVVSMKEVGLIGVDQHGHVSHIRQPVIASGSHFVGESPVVVAGYE